MDLTPYITQLREDLTTAATAGDEDTRRAAAVLSATVEPAARLAIMNALSDLAAEVTASLSDRVVDVRLDGRDVQVVVSESPTEQHTDVPPEKEQEPSPAQFFDPSGDISRITLRMFEDLKAKAERAAADQGVSLNAWLSQAVQGALRGQQPDFDTRPRGPRRTRNRMQGWVQG